MGINARLNRAAQGNECGGGVETRGREGRAMRRGLGGVVMGLVLSWAVLSAATQAAASAADDRLQIYELMDRYGVVHDFGTPEEYAGLFTQDGEIAVGTGAPVVKGHAALVATAA